MCCVWYTLHQAMCILCSLRNASGSVGILLSMHQAVSILCSLKYASGSVGILCSMHQAVSAPVCWPCTDPRQLAAWPSCSSHPPTHSLACLFHNWLLLNNQHCSSPTHLFVFLTIDSFCPTNPAQYQQVSDLCLLPLMGWKTRARQEIKVYHGDVGTKPLSWMLRFVSLSFLSRATKIDK